MQFILKQIVSPHVQEAVCVGPPHLQSLIWLVKIIQICKDLNVDGIHPGYGFLSENAAFARAITDADITLIGPSPEAMEVMGDASCQSSSKNFEVPMVPGTDEAMRIFLLPKSWLMRLVTNFD